MERRLQIDVISDNFKFSFTNTKLHKYMQMKHAWWDYDDSTVKHFLKTS